MKILLVEPRKSIQYYSPYPPLGLLKIAAYHKKMGDQVKLINGLGYIGFYPNKIYITSLFSYAWKPVHDVIRYYREKYTRAEIVVGGVYATLCKDHLMDTFKNNIRIHKGLYYKVENELPDYSLVPNWDASIVFSSRGCIRHCPYCAVNELEPIFEPKKSIKRYIYSGHKRIIFWDNNILASPFLNNIFNELKTFNMEVDFNQGLDARLLTSEIITELKNLRIPLLRLAYDTMAMRNSVSKAINLLKKAGFNGRRILVYCLYNYPEKKDTPRSFLYRIKDLLNWNVVAYPMRYEPLTPSQKNTYISPYWDPDLLEMIQKARRVVGYGGAFPPYEGLRKKITSAKNFYNAFKLRST